MLQLNVPSLAKIEMTPDMMIHTNVPKGDYPCETARLAAFSARFNRLICCDPTIDYFCYPSKDKSFDTVMKWINGGKVVITPNNIQALTEAAAFFESPRLISEIVASKRKGKVIGKDYEYQSAIRLLSSKLRPPIALFIPEIEIVAREISSGSVHYHDLWSLPLENIEYVLQSSQWDHSKDGVVFGEVVKQLGARPEFAVLFGDLDLTVVPETSIASLTEYVRPENVSGAIWMRLKERVTKNQ